MHGHSRGARSFTERSFFFPLILGLLALIDTSQLAAQTINGYVQFEQTFGYKSNEPPKGFRVQLVGASPPGNVFWPGDEARLNFQIFNPGDQPLRAAAHWELIQYATRCQPLDPFAPPIATKIRDAGRVPLASTFPPRASSTCGPPCRCPPSWARTAWFSWSKGTGGNWRPTASARGGSARP